MNFDKIIAFLSLLNRFENYQINDLPAADIKKNFIYKNNSTILKVLIPPWGNGEYLVTKLLRRRLIKKGYSCLSYTLPRRILSSDIYLTLKLFNDISEQIKLDIAELKVKHHFQQIDIISFSLGAVNACLIANNNPDISGLFLIIPGACLASSLWDGVRTQRLKKIYEKQGVNRGQLIKIWADLAPKNNIDALNNKKIFIAISLADKIIPYNSGQELANLLIKRYSPTIIEKNRRLGHYLTSIKYHLFSEILLK